VKKHLFMYVTDELLAHVSYKQTWDLWVSTNFKNEDDYIMSSMEADTNKGRLYFCKMTIWLSEDEFAQFLPENTDRA